MSLCVTVIVPKKARRCRVQNARKKEVDFITKVLYGDALEKLKMLPDESINCCVTSPPYYALRDYGVSGQIGLESTPEEYIERLVKVFREVKRVLRDDGTLWLNIADSYAGSGKGAWKNKEKQKEVYVLDPGSTPTKIKTVQGDIKPKDMIGIPWMLALALRADGWYLRQDIIWYKPNCMPESVRDRLTKSHEYIFLLSKSSHYYFDYKSIQEPAHTTDRNPPRGSKGGFSLNQGRRKQDLIPKQRYIGFNDRYTANASPLMRRKRDVWSVSTIGYKGAHFATFPPKLIEPCVLAGCPADGTVLDPFLGSGTTAEVAEKLGRNCIGIELNKEYKPLIENRISNLRKEG